MANAVPSSSKFPDANDDEKKRMPTSKESTLGGVWAPTSAKRDKLAELNIALEGGQENLDDAATPVQMEDLYLADGMKLVAKITDAFPAEDVKEIEELSEWLVEQQSKTSEMVDKIQFEQNLTMVIDKIDNLLSHYPPGQCLREVRDFFDPAQIPSEELSKLETSSPAELESQNSNFDCTVIRLRLLLARSAAEHLKNSWVLLTKNSDGDIDRAAVEGESLEPEAKTISLANVYKFLFANASGTCSDRVDAGWLLLDRDNDGLLDASEMNSVASLSLAPAQAALQTLFEEILDNPPLLLSEDGEEMVPAPKGWRQRRKEAGTKKTLVKMFQNACKNHFEDEVEINHRLRCIYAWANKEHQDNKLDSVLVDEGWTGRKRYVELAPKISLPEFREVQEEHFTHLDRMGEEILKSTREDLWVMQGKGRQNRELLRDCISFLAVVSLVDYVILTL
jgi:hypothetical protein